MFKREKQFTSDVSRIKNADKRYDGSVRSALKDEALKPKQKAQVKLIEQKAGKYVRSDRAASVFIKSRSGRQQIEKENVNLSELTK